MLDNGPTSDLALMQDPAFAQALRMCGQKPVCLGGGLFALQRRIVGIRVVMLPRAIPPPDLKHQLRDAGLQRSITVLSPEIPCTIPRSVQLLPARDVAIIDLARTCASRRATLHPKWRNQLVRAEAHHLTVTRHRLDPDPDAAVLRQEAQQARDRGYLN